MRLDTRAAKQPRKKRSPYPLISLSGTFIFFVKTKAFEGMKPAHSESKGLQPFGFSPLKK